MKRGGKHGASLYSEKEIIMKKGILIVAAALGVAFFAVPDSPADAWWGWHRGPDLRLRAFGGIFVTSNLEDGTPTPLDGRPFTALANGITKGSGSPVFLAQVEVAEDFVPDLAACSQQMPLRGDLTGSNILTFHDGSILQLGFTGSICCTDGSVFDCDLSGEVVGGEGRFEGVSGTYEGSARAESGRLTYEVSVDLD